MKHLAVACMLCLSAVLLASCGSQTDTGSASSTSEVASSAAQSSSAGGSGKLLASLEWPVTELTEGVPVPDLGVAPVDVSTGSSVRVVYEGATEDAVAAYVEQVKAAGYTEEQFESSTNTSYRYSGALYVGEETPSIEETDGDYVTVPKVNNPMDYRCVSVSYNVDGGVSTTTIGVNKGPVAKVVAAPSKAETD